MRKSIVSTLLCTAAICAVSSAAHAQFKLGTVDMNQVFTAYFKTKDAEAKINDARAAAKKELDERLETLKKAMDEINKTNTGDREAGAEQGRKGEVVQAAG